MALFQAPTQQSGKSPSLAKILEVGGYDARVVRIIDLGKQPGSGQYPEPAYKLRVTFELLDEFMSEVGEDGQPIMIQDPDEDEGVLMQKPLLDKPRWFDVDLTYNPDGFMGDRSNIFKFMTAVDAFEVKANPEQGINGHAAKQLVELLGEPLVVNLTTYTRKGGKNAGSLANKITTFAAMKGKDKKVAPPLVNPTLFFDLGNPDLEVFNKLPGGDSEYAIKNVIKGNLEFAGSKLDILLGGKPADNTAPASASAEEVDDAMKAELEAQAAAAKERAEQNAASGDSPF